jgi:hypothetical protein
VSKQVIQKPLQATEAGFLAKIRAISALEEALVH